MTVIYVQLPLSDKQCRGYCILSLGSGYGVIYNYITQFAMFNYHVYLLCFELICMPNLKLTNLTNFIVDVLNLNAFQETEISLACCLSTNCYLDRLLKNFG